MVNLGLAAAATGVGVAAGIGSGILMRDVAHDVSVGSIENLYSEWEQDRAKGRQPYTFNVYDPGGVYPTGAGDGIGGGAAFAFGIAPGAAAAVFGLGGQVTRQGAFGMLSPAVGAIVGVAGLALVGGAIGSMFGAADGEAEALARSGVDIDSQVDSVIERFDTDGDGELDIASGGRVVPESVRPIGSDGDFRSEFISMERTAKQADANGDERMTSDELRRYLHGFDTSGDGKISKPESRAYYDANNDAEVLSVGLDAPYA